MFYAQGITLIETLVVLLIIAMLAMIATGFGQSLLLQQRATKVAQQLRNGLNLARQSALGQGSYATLCPSQQGNRCQGSWAEGQLVFLDENGDGELNNNDRPLHHFPALQAGDTLRWSAFPAGKDYVTLTPAGLTKDQNGSFYYCPASPEKRYALRIIVNKIGRVRVRQEKNC